MVNNTNNEFALVEDNGGGLTLFFFKDGVDLTYIHTSYEFHPEDVLRDMKGLANGEDPVEEWDGNDIGDFDDPEDVYEKAFNFDGYIADETGIYPKDCGAAGRLALGLDDDDNREFVKWEEV